MSQNPHDAVAAYIAAHWDATVRDGRANTDPNIIPPPLPHTVPCIAGQFVALFYWDLYFTNLGLLRQGRLDLALSNCDALLYLLREKGFVPNSTFRGDDTRSQPPFLSLMVRDIYAQTHDRAWLADAADALAVEHRFWTERRATPTGLNRHGHHADDAYLRAFFAGLLVRRLGFDPRTPDAEALDLSAQHLAEAETGEDFTPRYAGRCLDHAAVSLNSLLFGLEENLAGFARELGRADDAARWTALAADRRARMDALLWDDAGGLYREYDFVHARQSTLAGVTTFYPLFVGAASAEQAARVRAALERFEREHGLAHNEPRAADGGPAYQWDYPNGWPPMFWVAAEGLWRYGFHEDARRVAGKYRALITRHFERTGQIWEKYDVTTGGLAGGEYEAQPMLGWTAGVYLACGELLERPS